MTVKTQTTADLRKYKNGVSYHTVVSVCEEEKAEIIVADELGEDCNAYELATELRADGNRVRIVHLKDIKFQ